MLRVYPNFVTLENGFNYPVTMLDFKGYAPKIVITTDGSISDIERNEYTLKNDKKLSMGYEIKDNIILCVCFNYKYIILCVSKIGS